MAKNSVNWENPHILLRKRQNVGIFVVFGEAMGSGAGSQGVKDGYKTYGRGAV